MLKILSKIKYLKSKIWFNGQVCKFKEIKDSEKLGIVIIHQELALIPELSIAENIFLGNEQAKGGVMAALAGMVLADRLNAATPKAGNNFELDEIADCYIGGVSALGGVGTVFSAIIGGLVIGMLNNGMSILGVNVDWQQTIKGLVLLAAVAFDIYSKNKVSKVVSDKKDKDKAKSGENENKKDNVALEV